MIHDWKTKRFTKSCKWHILSRIQFINGPVYINISCRLPKVLQRFCQIVGTILCALMDREMAPSDAARTTTIQAQLISKNVIFCRQRAWAFSLGNFKSRHCNVKHCVKFFHPSHKIYIKNSTSMSSQTCMYTANSYSGSEVKKLHFW